MTRRAPYQLTALVEGEHGRQRGLNRVFTMEIARAGHVSPQGVCWFSIDMAHFAGVPGTRVARGICAGVPDVVVLYRSAAYWLELKSDTGSLSDDQQEMCAALLLSGCRYAVVRDAWEALACIDAWNIPRKKLVKLQQREAA